MEKMKKMKKILISNDDGYLAPGIAWLAKKLGEIAEIIVVAPDRNRSGASNSLTLEAPLRVHKVRDGWFCVNGTPTDCVHVAITGLLDILPDMVVSGINGGLNLGDDVLYSGTVAAAIEGRFLGLPSLAFSLDDQIEHYEAAACIAKVMVQNVFQNPLPPNTILNINIPDKPLNELKEYEITRLGRRHKAENSVQQEDPRGNTVYWIGLPGPEEEAGPGTDFYAVRAGHVSISPIQLDWTNYQSFDDLSVWVSKLNRDLTKKSK